MVFNNIYRGKKVFLSGHTGFKGGWLSLWLKSLGAEVLGYSLEPDFELSLFKAVGLNYQTKSVFGNILDREKLNKTIAEFKPDIIFHLAAQPLVRRSYLEPLNTYETNVIGTLNVLEAARHCPSVRAFVNVTTDKCYENKESSVGYRENESMGGHDMYSSSKGCVEIMSSSYRRSFLQGGSPYAMATARAGNVIGGGDWASDRLIPDCIRFINQNLPVEIRNPSAVRPWQHVLEPLFGYLLLGEKLLESGDKFAEGFNFGPGEENTLTVEDVVKSVIKHYEKGDFVVHKKDALHEANMLMLNIEKADKALGWKPVYGVDEAVKNTVCWYKAFYAGENMLKFTLAQINDYQYRISCKKSAIILK